MSRQIKNITLDNLASMVSKGFENIEDKIEGVNFKLDDLENGQEQVRLRLDNVAYKFKLQEVQKRVSHLEKKAGIRYP